MKLPDGFEVKFFGRELQLYMRDDGGGFFRYPIGTNTAIVDGSYSSEELREMADAMDIADKHEAEWGEVIPHE